MLSVEVSHLCLHYRKSRSPWMRSKQLSSSCLLPQGARNSKSDHSRLREDLCWTREAGEWDAAAEDPSLSPTNILLLSGMAEDIFLKNCFLKNKRIQNNTNRQHSSSFVIREMHIKIMTKSIRPPPNPCGWGKMWNQPCTDVGNVTYNCFENWYSPLHIP